MRVYSRSCPLLPEHAAADPRGDQRPRVRRRHVPLARRRPPHRGRERRLQQHRHRERPDEHRARRELAAAAARRRRALERHPADRPPHRRAGGAPHGPRLARRPRRRGPAGVRPRGRSHVQVQPVRAPDDEAGARGRTSRTASLAAAIELEDRNQLMLGITDNLPEAIRCFDQEREPVYTDQPGAISSGGASDPHAHPRRRLRNARRARRSRRGSAVRAEEPAPALRVLAAASLTEVVEKLAKGFDGALSRRASALRASSRGRSATARLPTSSSRRAPSGSRSCARPTPSTARPS